MGKLKIGDRVHITDFAHAYVTKKFSPYGVVQAIRDKKQGDLNVLVLMDDENEELKKHYVLCFNDVYLEKAE